MRNPELDEEEAETWSLFLTFSQSMGHKRKGKE
jgi:hypothetical protein